MAGFLGLVLGLFSLRAGMLHTRDDLGGHRLRGKKRRIRNIDIYMYLLYKINVVLLFKGNARMSLNKNSTVYKIVSICEITLLN